LTKTLLAAAAGLALLAAGAPALAHHSFAAQYDGNKPVRLTGKLVKIEWTNPHSYIHLAVTSKKDGVVTEWACEGANPGALSRRGFQRGDIKIGDTLTIDGFLAKNGSHLIDARRIFLASGKVIYGGSAGDGGPGDTGAE
jgi:hypothetical protein